MSIDEHLTRVLVERLCAALREVVACNEDPIDPRTLDHLTTIEAWAQGKADDEALARATAALDAIAEEFLPEAMDSGCFHPDYQTANTAWQIGDFAASQPSPFGVARMVRERGVADRRLRRVLGALA